MAEQKRYDFTKLPKDTLSALKKLQTWNILPDDLFYTAPASEAAGFGVDTGTGLGMGVDPVSGGASILPIMTGAASAMPTVMNWTGSPGDWLSLGGSAALMAGQPWLALPALVGGYFLKDEKLPEIRAQGHDILTWGEGGLSGNQDFFSTNPDPTTGIRNRTGTSNYPIWTEEEAFWSEPRRGTDRQMLSKPRYSGIKQLSGPMSQIKAGIIDQFNKNLMSLYPNLTEDQKKALSEPWHLKTAFQRDIADEQDLQYAINAFAGETAQNLYGEAAKRLGMSEEDLFNQISNANVSRETSETSAVTDPNVTGNSGVTSNVTGSTSGTTQTATQTATQGANAMAQNTELNDLVDQNIPVMVEYLNALQKAQEEAQGAYGTRIEQEKAMREGLPGPVTFTYGPKGGQNQAVTTAPLYPRLRERSREAEEQSGVKSALANLITTEGLMKTPQTTASIPYTDPRTGQQKFRTVSLPLALLSQYGAEPGTTSLEDLERMRQYQASKRAEEARDPDLWDYLTFGSEVIGGIDEVTGGGVRDVLGRGATALGDIVSDIFTSDVANTIPMLDTGGFNSLPKIGPAFDSLKDIFTEAEIYDVFGSVMDDLGLYDII